MALDSLANCLRPTGTSQRCKQEGNKAGMERTSFPISVPLHHIDTLNSLNLRFVLLYPLYREKM